mmetsp:Transcript_16469/g.24906  ORF Transcript_16469/g.24906 Transcript_16469/m.24906 type:complete len:403 (+) Transcript_16469:179-1387(+)
MMFRRVVFLASFLHAGVASSLFSTPVKTVTISGGTHGNEYTGIWCIKSIEKQRELFNANTEATNAPDAKVINVFKEYPSLSIDTLLANPKAYMANRRFIDTDMNREFSIKKLQHTTETCSEENDASCDSSQASLPYESIRAKEIESMFGAPKTGSTGGDDGDANSDIVIDLHTTTANMGITLIFTEGDALMSAAAAYALHKCKTEYGYENVHILLLPKTEKNDRTHLPSVGTHDFTIEVGPTPQGVIRHDIVEQTEAALHSLLEFLHLSNMELENKTTGTTVLDRLRSAFPNGVPCYQSAPAVGAKELHGKIQWPTLDDNPNFPAAMVHKSLQDRDYQPLRTGDPLFVGLDGAVIPYDGSYGDEVLLMFVNEGGYYYSSSGTGIGVAVFSRYDFETGNNVEA